MYGAWPTYLAKLTDFPVPFPDFTMRNTSVAFVINYQTNSGASLRFYDFERDTGCYKIHLTGNYEDRIRVSHGQSATEDWDIDTQNYKATGARLCSKWANIMVTNRDASIKPMKGTDDSNI